jgi:hypothetical protein
MTDAMAANSEAIKNAEDVLLHDLDSKVRDASAVASDAATKKGEIDGFVTTIQDLYDAATAGSLIELAV